jgi:cytochrome c oxidase subunit 4
MATHDTHAHDHDADDAHGLDDGRVHVHVATAQFYVGIFIALVCLTILTVTVSYFDFGAFNIVVALVIASAKAALVAVFFMHLRHDSKFNALTFIASFLFLGIFIMLTYDDLGRRARIDSGYIKFLSPQTGVMAPGGLPSTTATADEAAPEGAPPGANEKK